MVSSLAGVISGSSQFSLNDVLGMSKMGALNVDAKPEVCQSGIFKDILDLFPD
jgi:hypothetical protein